MSLVRTVRAAEIGNGADDRSITVTCSTEMLGRDDLVVMTDGIDLTWYRTNPVWLWAHDSEQPIARADEIGVVDGKLVAEVRFPPAGVSAKSDEILGLVRAGVVNTCSIGFDPKGAEPIDPKNPDAGTRITKCELQEVSLVSIPALPDALVTERAMKEIRRMATKRADADWRCGAAGDLPIDDSGEWDGKAAEDSIFTWAGGDDFDPEKAKKGFLLYDAANDKLRGSYKLPFARVSGAELKAVEEGLRAAASRLPQTDAPENELNRAKQVLDNYEKKAGIDGEDRGAHDKGRRHMKRSLDDTADVRAAIVKRGLYEVGCLAWILEQLNMEKCAAEIETSVEGDGSQVPAMLGAALQQLGEALCCMTEEEVDELLASDGDDVETENDEESALVGDDAERSVHAFRLGLHRARRALRRAPHSASRSNGRVKLHQRMASLYRSELANTR